MNTHPVHPQYDIKNRRPFLKKTKIPTVTMDTLHMGAVVTVYSRQLKIVEYGDSHTEAAFSLARQQTLCVVKPGAVHLAGKVINASQKSGFSVARVKMAQLSSAEASAMFGEASATELSSGPSMGVSLVGDDAVSSFKALAKELVSSLGDCVVYSESADAVASQTSAFFANAPACRLADTALCLVKPSSMDHLGLVLDAVMGAGFTMTGASTFTLDRVDAVEFLEVYKGVVPEFAASVDELTSGPFVAIEVAQRSDPMGPARTAWSRRCGRRAVRRTRRSRGCCVLTPSAQSLGSTRFATRCTAPIFPRMANSRRITFSRFCKTRDLRNQPPSRRV